MRLNDLQSEWAFYGRQLDTVGHIYLTPREQPSLYPDLLFLCIYTCRVLVEKKFTLSAATDLQKHLLLGPVLEKSCRWEESRAYTFPARAIEYRGYAKSAISSSLMLREKPRFRFGYMGFGLFSNGRRFDFCAAASVFVLIETIYKKNAGDSRALDLLWDCAEKLGGAGLGVSLRKGNFLTAAADIYRSATGDPYPSTEAQR